MVELEYGNGNGNGNWQVATTSNILNLRIYNFSFLLNFYNAEQESATSLEWFGLGSNRLVRLNLGKKNRKGELKREFFSLRLLGLGKQKQKQNMYGKENRA